MIKTDAVLVTFNPDLNILYRCIESLNHQVRNIWVVDNSPKTSISKAFLEGLSEKIELIELGENKGIAFAQNKGIQCALENDSDFIVLSDQDTTFPETYVQDMLPLFEMKVDGVGVAAVAPSFYDQVQMFNEGFRVKSLFGFSKISPKSGIHSISFAIASGKILKSSSLDDIGLMDAELFIDWVDMEWCWRATGKGYKILGNADVMIQHQLGDKTVALANKSFTVRSPMRHYFMTRNAFYLAKRCSYIDLLHRMNLVYRGFRYILLFSTFSRPRMTNFKMTMLGLYHGITDNLGRLDK